MKNKEWYYKADKLYLEPEDPGELYLCAQQTAFRSPKAPLRFQTHIIVLWGPCADGDNKINEPFASINQPGDGGDVM